jgi:3-mercaptopyruvate sulfurtransferase SseA
MLRSLLLVPFLLAGPAGTAPPMPPPPPASAPAPAPMAPSTAPAPAPASADSVRRVPVAEAQEALKNGKAVFVDVRSAGEYQTAHVHGALSIPWGEIAQRSKELPRESFIITYCT